MTSDKGNVTGSFIYLFVWCGVQRTRTSDVSEMYVLPAKHNFKVNCLGQTSEFYPTQSCVANDLLFNT